MDADCIFCRISNGALPADKIYEDEAIVAFLDIRPITKGHTLVVPKRHMATWLDADAETVQKLTAAVHPIARALYLVTAADGFNVGVNSGEAAGQDVPHLHVHIIPRYRDDHMPVWPHQKYESGEAERLAEAMRQAVTHA